MLGDTTYGQFRCGHWGWGGGSKLPCMPCRMEHERLEDDDAHAEALEWSHPAEEVTSWRLY